MIFPSPVSWGVLSVLETVKRHPLYIKCIVFFFTICLFVFFIYLCILFIPVCIHIFSTPGRKASSHGYAEIYILSHVVYYSLPQIVFLGPQARKCRTLLESARSKFKHQPMFVSTTMIVEEKHSEPSARSNRINENTRIKYNKVMKKSYQIALTLALIQKSSSYRFPHVNL